LRIPISTPLLRVMPGASSSSARPLRSSYPFVERRFGVADAKERREAVEPYVRRLVEGGADEIVLACTHFLHLRDDIAAAAGPGVEVVDSRAGVVKRLRQVLSERGLLNGRGRGVSEAAKPYGIFLPDGDEKPLKQSTLSSLGASA